MPSFGICRLLARVTIAASCVAIGACQGMYLHNPDRAAVAAAAKKSIDTVDVAAISKAEQENLAKLLEEEIKAIDARSKLVASLAVLQLAASDQRINRQYDEALKRMELALNTKSMLLLQKSNECLLEQRSAIDANKLLLDDLVSFLYKARNVPACAPQMPSSTERPGGLPENEHADFDARYKFYADSCETLMKTCRNLQASHDLAEVRKTETETLTSVSTARKNVQDAQKAYKGALDANKDRAKAAASTAKDIQDKADDLLNAVNKLAKASPSAANQIKGTALVDLLTAAAGGKADSTDADLAPALEIARSIPSLAQSISTARAQRAQVPVSHLLLALNNLTIQAERDERLRALDAEEISVVERKIDTLDAQANLWRHYNNSLCNLILLSDKREHPGAPCDTILFEEVKQGDSIEVKCTVRYMEAEKEPPKTEEAKKEPAKTKLVTIRVDGCVLGKSWRALFAQERESSRLRQLNEAAAAYLHARLVAYMPTVEEFRRIAIDHRRAAVRSEAALQQWKNLVSVPASELEGYYGGGIKPEALADLIVKALGFTAIAIGVAQ